MRSPKRAIWKGSTDHHRACRVTQDRPRARCRSRLQGQEEDGRLQRRNELGGVAQVASRPSAFQDWWWGACRRPSSLPCEADREIPTGYFIDEEEPTGSLARVARRGTDQLAAYVAPSQDRGANAPPGRQASTDTTLLGPRLGGGVRRLNHFLFCGTPRAQSN